MTRTADQFERPLIDINTSDIISALGWENAGVLRRWVALAARPPATRFARRMRAFDRDVETSGVRRAARTMARSYVRELHFHGARRIPARGPALLLSNHPGMTDTLALLAAIPRADLRILAAERPFLRALPALSRSLITISDNKDKRMLAVRQAVSHLRAAGRCSLSPRGRSSPTPRFCPAPSWRWRGGPTALRCF